MKKTITQHLNLAILFLLSIAFTLNANPKNSAFNLNLKESTESLNTFYSLYEKNWGNTQNFNSDVFWAQKNNTSKKQTTEATPAIEVDDCASNVSAVDYVNFSKSMSVVAMNETDQSDNYENCCYNGQFQGHLHPKRLKLEYIGSGNPWIVFRYANSSGVVHFQGNVSNGQSLIVDGTGIRNGHGQEGLDTNTWYSIAGAAVKYHTSCSTNLDVGHTINGHFKVLAIEMPLVSGMGGVSCTEGDFCEDLTNAGGAPISHVICTNDASLPLTTPPMDWVDASGGQGGTIEYQWQMRWAPNVWYDIPGATNKNYNPPNSPYNASTNPYGWKVGENYWRRKAKRTCSTTWIVTTDEYYWISENVQNPGSISGTESKCGGYDPALISNSNSASGGGGAWIRYQWQYKTTGNWIDISGATNDSYNPGSISQTTTYRRGAIRAGPECNSDYKYSNEVTKTVTTNFTNAGSIAANESNCGAYNPANITNNISPSGGSGGNTEYTWQWSTNNSSWTSINQNSASYDPNINISQTTYYRRGARRSGCSTYIYSNSVTKTVTTNFTNAGSIAANESNCGAYNPANITNNTSPSGGSGGNTEYTWQWSTNNSNWTSINQNSASYDPNINISQTTYYRRGARRSGCSTYIYSNSVTKTVTTNFTNAGSIAANESNCGAYNPANITNNTSPSGGSGGNTEYTWQWSTNNSNWTSINQNSASYDPNINISQTTYYRRGARRSGCSTYIYSNSVTKTVDNTTLNLQCEYRIDNVSWIPDDCSVVLTAGQKLELSTNPNSLASYTWTGPNGFSGNGNIGGDILVSNTVTSAMAGTYKVTATNSNGCSGTKEITVSVCPRANNTTATASITENQTKSLTGTPSGGTWSIVSGNGSITGSTYTPSNINTNTSVTIRYTIAASGNCAATSDDVTFTVTPVCDVVANNTTATASITEGQTKSLTGTPSGGTWSIVSGNGSITGSTYTPSNINTNTSVTIRYTIAANGSCAATSDDVTFTVTPCPVAVNTTSNASITENQTKTLVGSPSGGTWSIVSGGGSISGNTYTPTNISVNTSVTIRYTIAATSGCNAATADVTFTVTPCPVAVNTTSSASITENQTKTLVGSPSGGTWSIVSGGGSISGNTYTPADVSVNTSVTIRYTIAANGSCAATSDDVTFTVTPCPVAVNTTSSASITENQTKTLVGSPSGGTWSIVSGGGSISGNTYTPADVSVNTSVTIRYTIAANGSCAATSDDVTFTVTPCPVAVNTTSSASITEGETKTLTGAPAGGTWSIVSGGGSITGTTYTPDDINTDTSVTIRYTIAADGSCAATSDDVTFTVTPVCDVVANNTTTAASITEGETKTLTGAPAGGTWSIVSGGGSISGNTYTPTNISVNTNVTIRYTIAADGSCAATSDDVTFTVTPVCDVVADNTTTAASITEGETKTLTGAPAGGTWSIVSGGGGITGTTYTPDDINADTSVTIRYTIATDGSCAATSDDVTFTVTPVCDVVADNTTTAASITEGETKTLTGAPAGGTWSIVSGGGSITGTTYTPDDINTDTAVTIRYTIAADGSCAATSDDVTFTVTPVCDVVADNTTTAASITEGETKILTGSPAGGTWSIISGGGSITGTTYTPDDINTDTAVTIRYTIAADGSCAATSDDVTFTVTPVCDVVADNTTTAASITEGETKTLTGAPSGGTWSIVAGGGSITGTTYTPDDINTDTAVTIRYTIAADGSCAATSDDVTFTVTPVCGVVVDNTTTTASITEGETKTLTGAPAGGTWSIVSGGGSITGTTYTPNDINTDTTVTIRYTIAADGACAATSDDVTFTVTPVCGITANNTTSTADITGDQTKLLTGTPSGGAWSIVSGGGSITGNTYTPANTSNNNVIYAIANENQNLVLQAPVGSVINSITFASYGTPTGSNGNYTTSNCHATSSLNIIESYAIGNNSATIPARNAIFGDPCFGTGKRLYVKATYTAANINTNTDVTIRYTIAADGDCPATSDDVTFTVTPVCSITAKNTTATASINENQTKTLTGSPSGGSWNIVSGGGTINGSTYTPNDINTDTTVTIRYTIAADGACVATTDDVTFTVTAVNSNPTATDDSYTTTEDTPVALIPLTEGVADSDPENDVLTITSINGVTLTGAVQSIPVTNGTVDIDTNGVITFTPEPNYNGTVSFPYTISDGNGGTDTANEIINITPVNDAPVAVDDTYTTAEETPVTLVPLTDDTDPDGDTLTVTSINGVVLTPGTPQTITVPNGTVTTNAGGVITFTPENNFNGTVTFPYTISDGNGGTDTANEIINIIPVNDAPVAVDDTYTTDEETPVTLVPLTDDTDPDGDTLVVTSINGVTLTPGTPQTITVPNGTVTTSAGGVITFTPENNFNGTVTFPYTISDGNGGTDTANEIITVIRDFGSIGNLVWYDTDEDGIKDAGENGLAGATVTLDPGTQSDPSDDITINTDANGNYLFENLPIGDYVISVSLGSVTSGIPAGFTAVDLVQIFDADGLGSPSKSYLTLGKGEDNLEQDFAYIVPSGGTSGGNSGGVESESLGDAISKIYVGRKKNSMPTEFVKSTENLYNKAKMKTAQPYQGKGQTMLDMFPTQLVAGNIANVTSPTDILDYTVADEVLSVDFSLDGKTKGVVLGIKTSDKIYNHTKASCDRLRGAEILNIQTIRLGGYNFLMQGLKQRNGIVEYAISFAVAKNNNDGNYTIQTNWYVNDYTKFNDVYNFQVWSTKPADTQKMVTDILKNLQSFIPVNQTEIQKVPETYASKIFREKGELVVNLRSTKVGNIADISMVELYSETANNIKHRYNTLDTEIQQSLRLNIADGYEYEGLIEVEKEVEDAFYHADGNWGLDYDKKYTEILNYFVWNNFDRTYQDDEYSINRNVEIKAKSEYDYLTVYKSLLPGTLSADYSEYKYLSFTAKGSGLMELGLIKSSVENWKEQYRIMVNLSEEEQTYYVPFEYFSSTGTTAKITADDLTTITFTFLPVEANTKELDLFISDLKFTKTAVEDQIIGKIEKFENNFMAYPNPSQGNINVLLFSKLDTEATVSLFDVTGKEIYVSKVQLKTGKNEIDFNVKVKPGILFLKVNSKQVNYGISKIMFR